MKPSTLIAELATPTSRGVTVALAEASVVGSFSGRTALAHRAGAAVSSLEITIRRTCAGLASCIDERSSDAEIRSVASFAVEAGPVVFSAVARAGSAVENTVGTAVRRVSVTNRAVLPLPSSRASASAHRGALHKSTVVLAESICKKTRRAGISTPELRSGGRSRTNTTTDAG